MKMIAAANDWFDCYGNQAVAPRTGGTEAKGRRISKCTQHPAFPGQDDKMIGVNGARFFLPRCSLFGIAPARAGEVRVRSICSIRGRRLSYSAKSYACFSSHRDAGQTPRVIFMRMDLERLGDSANEPGQPDNEVFRPRALARRSRRDRIPASRYGSVDITLGGLCSGDYTLPACRVAGAAGS